jgi:hypothetical protein
MHCVHATVFSKAWQYWHCIESLATVAPQEGHLRLATSIRNLSLTRGEDLTTKFGNNPTLSPTLALNPLHNPTLHPNLNPLFQTQPEEQD